MYGRTLHESSSRPPVVRVWAPYGQVRKQAVWTSSYHADPDKLIGIRGHPFGFPFAAISAPNTYIRGFFQRQKWRRWASVRECASVLVSRGSTAPQRIQRDTMDQWTDNGQDSGMVVRTPRRGRGRRKKQWDNTPIVVGHSHSSAGQLDRNLRNLPSRSSETQMALPPVAPFLKQTDDVFLSVWRLDVWTSSGGWTLGCLPRWSYSHCQARQELFCSSQLHCHN